MGWDWHWFVVPGSALCVLPLVLLLGLAVWAHPGGHKAALRWWAAVSVAVLLAAGSKIAFYGWGWGIRAWDLTCFSGHVVLALSLWPVALAMLVPPTRPGWRRLAVLAGVGFAVLIGVSRVKIGAHPVSEVVAGALLGGVVSAIGLHALRRQWLPPRVAMCLVVILATAPLACSLLDRRFPALPSERWLAVVGASLSGRDAPVDRRQWRAVRERSPDAETALSR